jgi:uncharacterized protein
MMIIKISNLSEGFHNFDFDNDIHDIGLADPFFGNFNAKIKLGKSHNQIILNVHLVLNANFDCDRCGINYNKILETDFQLVYLFEKAAAGADSLNIIYLHPDADKINISSDLRDYAMLAIPMKNLCIEDCQGLCYKCGKNLNEGSCNCEKTESYSRKSLLELKKRLSNN